MRRNLERNDAQPRVRGGTWYRGVVRVLCLLAVGAAQTMASDFPRTYACFFARHAPVIDGLLQDSVWRAVPWTEDFVDIEGDVRPRPPLRTRARMLWDDRYLYIGAELEEPHVWGNLRQRDTVIFRDNDFEVFIDPDGDNHLYYEIEINALNTVWDLLLIRPYRDGGPAVDAWDITGLRTAVAVQGSLNNPRDRDRGWSVEMALPWVILDECAPHPGAPLDGEEWRINFSRVEWDHEVVNGWYRVLPNRPEHNWVWSPQGAVDMHRPERWGYVRFVRDLSAGGTLLASPDRGIRDLLMRLYAAQRDYYARHQRWSASPQDLGFDFSGVDPRDGRPVVTLTAEGYLVTYDVAISGGRTRTWYLRHDSRLWSVDR